MVSDTLARKNSHFIIWSGFWQSMGSLDQHISPSDFIYNTQSIGLDSTGLGVDTTRVVLLMCFTLLHWFSMSLLLTRPNKVCFSLESTTVSGPPLSPCTTITYEVLNLFYCTSQVAECSLSAHSEKLSRVSPETVDWHLSASTMDTLKKKPIKQ